MSKTKKILVVCTGNACRSPMAEGFLKKYLDPEDGFEVYSAGISAVDGQAPTDLAITVMKECGIDISAYSSTAFEYEMAELSDIILVMTQAHKSFIVNTVPGVKPKTFLYKEFAGIVDQDKDIADPIGRPIETYRSVRDTLKNLTQDIIVKLMTTD